MIFGVLNPEKNWCQIFSGFNSPAYCSHFTLRNPKKVICDSIIHTYFRLFTLSQNFRRKQTVTPLPSTPEYFVVFFIFFHTYLVPIRHMDELGKHLVTTWAEFQQSLVDNAVDQWRKGWKHVSMQKVVTLNICCNVACLTFYLPHIITGSFQTQQCQPTTGFFQSYQRLEECNIPSVSSVRLTKNCAFYKIVRWHFSGVMGKG